MTDEQLDFFDKLLANPAYDKADVYVEYVAKFGVDDLDDVDYYDMITRLADAKAK